MSILIGQKSTNQIAQYMVQNWHSFRMLFTSVEAKNAVLTERRRKCSEGLQVIFGEYSDIVENYILKGEGHSKNCVFFSITNKKFALSWVTHHCFSFCSGCDPSEKEVENLTLGAAILKGSWRPGCISVTSFHPRVCLFFWALVWLLLKPERASHSGGGNNQDELNDRLENAVWCTCERCTTIPKQRECVCCWEQLE